MMGAALGVWLLVLAVAKILPNSVQNPLAQIAVLTFTVVLWPMLAIGALLVVSWLVIWLITGR